MAQLFWLSGQQLLDGNGKPYAAAKAFFYDTGTTTPKATYSDAGLTAINANPVIADGEGRFPDIYLVAGRYKVDLRTTANVSIDVLDPVDATQQLISSASAPATTYAFLRYHNTSDGNVYRRNAANSGWILEGPVDSLLNAASTSDVLTGTDTTKAVTPDALAALWQRGTDIASASPLSLPAGGGGVFTVTGTSTVNGITTAHGGRRVTLRFSGSLQLTHSASFVLPGGVNITTAAGDQAEFINDAAQDASGSNWRCVNYLRADGSVTVPDLTAADQSAMEAATSITRYATPGRMRFHPGVCKAFVEVNGLNNPATIITSFNVTSVTDEATGDFTVNYTTAFSSGNYATAMMCGFNVGDVNLGMKGRGDFSTKLSTSYRVMTNNSTVAADLNSASMSVFGDQ